MSLNIKNERVHALAREAASRMGRNQTSVIELALKRLLDELDVDDETDTRRELIRSMQADFAAGPRPAMTIDDLYDEDGLPA